MILLVHHLFLFLRIIFIPDSFFMGACMLLVFQPFFSSCNPRKLFKKCVPCCGFQAWHALHTFVESFQEQYKDGSNGTCDFRMVSASFFILRIWIIATFLKCIYCSWGSSYQLLPVCMNNVDILILLLIGMSHTLFWYQHCSYLFHTWCWYLIFISYENMNICKDACKLPVSHIKLKQMRKLSLIII